jgi:tetratricopeptide (TPR) repeat protein
MKLLVGLFATVLLTQAPALAEEPDSSGMGTATAHFKRAREHFQASDFRAALEELQHAYELAPDHRLLYSIAQTKQALNDHAGAAESYARYIAESKSSPASQRGDTHAMLAAETRTPSMTITVTLHHLEVSATTLERLQRLADARDHSLDVLVEQLGPVVSALPKSAPTVGSEASHEISPLASSELDVQPVLATKVVATKSRVLRGIDSENPYSSRE